MITAIKNVWRGLQSLARTYPALPASNPGAAAYFGGGRSSAAGVCVTEEGALSLSAVFAACNLLSRVVASLPLKVYQRDGERRRPAVSNPAYRLLASRPNPEMTSATLRRVLEFHRLLWGRCYAEVQWLGSGAAAALWPVEPWRVQVLRDPDGALYYRIDGKRRVEPDDMLALHLLSYDGVCGRSWVDYAVQSLGLGMATQEFAGAYFGNGATPGAVLKLPGQPAKEVREQTREDYERRHQGAGQAHRMAMLWGGAEVEPMPGFNPEQSQLIEQRRFGAEEVARWLNVPPHLLRDLSRATFSNIEQQGIDFVTFSIGPTLVDYEQEFGRKLLNPPDLYCKHDLNGLLRGDSAARAAYYRDLWGIGVLSINDILDKEDMDPVGGGEERWVAANMVPLSRALEAPVEAPAPTPPGSDQPAPQPPASPAPAMRALAAQTLARLAGVEATAVRRAAAAGGNFVAWLDEFYPAHEGRLASALLAVCGPVSLLRLDPAPVAALGPAWCAESRAALLDAAGSCTAAGLPAAAEALLAGWEGRPAASAARLWNEDQERDDSGRFGSGGGSGGKDSKDGKDGGGKDGGGKDGGDGGPDEATQEARDEEDAATDEQRQAEDEKAQEERDKVEAAREAEDKATERQREKEDKEADKEEKATDKAREKEDAATERQREKEDEKAQAARDKADEKRSREDDKVESAREKEDTKVQDARDREDNDEADAWAKEDEKSPPTPEKEAAREAKVKADVQRREAEDKAVESKREAEDKTRQEARDYEDAAMDKADAEREQSRAKEDKATEEKRAKEDGEREARDAAREARREVEDRAAEAKREKEDEAHQKAEADRAAKREKEDKAKEEKRKAEDKAGKKAAA